MSGHGALHLWLSSQRTPRLVAGDFLQELTLLRLARLPGFAVIMAMYLMVRIWATGERAAPTRMLTYNNWQAAFCITSVPVHCTESMKPTPRLANINDR